MVPEQHTNTSIAELLPIQTKAVFDLQFGALENSHTGS